MQISSLLLPLHRDFATTTAITAGSTMQEKANLMNRFLSSISGNARPESAGGADASAAAEAEPQSECLQWPGPEPEPDTNAAAAMSTDDEMSVETSPSEPSSAGSSGSAAGGAAGGAVGGGASRSMMGIPLPTFNDDAPSQPSPPMAIAARPEMIVGRSLCDMHSDEALSHAMAAHQLPIMGHTPPLLSMIRTVAKESPETSPR